MELLAKTFNFKENYAAVNNHSGNTKVVVRNVLVQVSELRAFDIQQVDYKDRFSVFKALETSLGVNNISTINNENISRFALLYAECKTSRSKLKTMCEFNFGSNSESDEAFRLYVPNKNYRDFYNTLGPERLKSLGYDVTKINNYISKLLHPVSSNSDIESAVKEFFKVGSQYSNSQAKEKLAEIYKSYNSSEKAKARDLSKWFDIKPCKVRREGGGQDNGIEILGNKS